MSRLPPSLSKRLKWRVEWLVQVAAESIVARLSGKAAFLLGESIGHLLWHFMAQRRRIVFKNLRIVLAGEKTLDEIQVLARQSFIRSVANLVSAVHTAHMPAGVLESQVTVENPELLEAAMRDGRGCLLLPPHMGNWEILSRINRLFPEGSRIGALYRPLNNPHLDARLLRKRRSEGTHTFSKRDSLLAIIRFVKEGGIMGVLADQRAGWQGVPSDFFGRLTRSTPLPSILIRRCKVPAMAISVKTTAPGCWSVKYHRVTDSTDTQACMDTIERAMRESLVDVFWFQDRWKCYGSRKTPIRKWLGGDEHRSAKHPHRALVWQVGMPCEDPLPLDWLHPDVRYELAVGENQAAPSWAVGDTVIHRLPVAGNQKETLEHLMRIDNLAALPLDFILSPRPDATLHRVCRSVGINHISLTKA